MTRLTSIRLDDLLTPEEPLGKAEPEKEEAEPPAFDPFLDPSARDELLGEESPVDKSGGEWQYLTEPSTEDSLSGKIPPADEPTDNLDFLSSLSDDSSSEGESPAQEPGEEWDFLTSPSAEEEPIIEEPVQKEEPTKSPPDEWDFLTSLSAEEEPILEEPAQVEEPTKSPVDEWDFLTSPSAEEEPIKEESAKEPVDGWDFLTEPDTKKEPLAAEQPDPETAGGLDILASLDEEKRTAVTEQPAGEPAGELDFLTPDPESEPGPIGFRPDLYDEDEDPLPEFGSPGFSEDSGWLDMLQDPDSRKSAVETPPEPSKPQTDWLDKIKRLNKSSDMVDEDSSFPDWLSVSDTPAEEISEEVKSPEYSPSAVDSDEAAPASDLPAWLQIDGDDESLNAFLLKKDRTNEEYKPAIVRGITDKLPPKKKTMTNRPQD